MCGNYLFVAREGERKEINVLTLDVQDEDRQCGTGLKKKKKKE